MVYIVDIFSLFLQEVWWILRLEHALWFENLYAVTRSE